MTDTLRSSMKYLLIFLVSLLAAACGKSSNNDYHPTIGQQSTAQLTEYIIGIHPLHNPQRMMDLYGPIVEYINYKIPEAHFKLEASRNYEEFDRKLYAGHFAFAMPNPYESLLALKYGYRIFGKMADDENFRGIILVRKDSTINKISDLKGKAVSYPAQSALAATMMPQYYLQTHGIDVDRDIENRYVGSQESSILNVYRGHVAAAATWPVPWKLFSAEHPEWADQLLVKWETEALINNGWVVRKEVPAAIADKVAHLLFSLQETEQGRMMLNRLPLSRFEPATDATYQPVHQFLEKFSRKVRPIEH